MNLDGLRCVLFVSRNKDNTQLPDFKERRKNFLSTDLDKARADFDSFVGEGVIGEVSRMYVSVNAREDSKVKKQLIANMVLFDDIKLTKLNSLASSIAMKSEHRETSHWLFDFDDDKEKLPDFLKELEEAGAEIMLVKPTKSGHAVIVSRGFDTVPLLIKWTEVTLHRDGLLLLEHQTKD